MSDAALRYVRNCSHPAVKDGTRDLFEAIAHFVPEGETTTPSIGMPALATQARRHRRTVVKRLADLVEIGEVDVLDGGLGKIARYRIVHLDGAPPIVAAPLPLRADLQAVARRPSAPTLPDDTTGDLFADAPASVRSESEEPVLIDHRLARDLWRSITGWATQPVLIVHRLVSYLWRSITGWRSDGEEPVLIDHRLPIEPVIAAHPLDVDGTRARDVLLLLKETTTTTAPPSEPPRPRAVESPPCRWLGKSHAWCVGRFHVPMEFHIEERRKLPRQPGETDADLDAQLFARYAAVFAAVPETTDLRGFKNDFEICKAYLRTPSQEATAKARASTPNPREIPVDLYHLAEEQARQRREGSR